MKINQKISAFGLIRMPVQLLATISFIPVWERKNPVIRQYLLVMKLTILIMTLFLLQVSASTKAQITLNEKQASLQKVLKSISKQSGYDLIYQADDLKNTNPVNIKLNNSTVEKALEVLFEGQPLLYEISDKTVMVKKKAETNSFLEKLVDRFAAINVHGRVVDEHKQGISGVSITVKDGKGGSVTGADGSFFVKNVDENATLVCSYVGYKKLEITLKGEEDLGIHQLVLSSSPLDEVQIMFGGTTSRRISTANISSITKDDIANQPINNPLLALQGKVPGLVVTPTSGAPGAAMKIQLRGQNSLSGFISEPLIVINGVPVSNNISAMGGLLGGQNFNPDDPAGNGLSALSFLNPNDIESIDVLKDADATAIYGSRGANGVILITTKKGKIGQAVVNINASTSFSEIPKKLSLMNTTQYLEMRREAFKNDGIDLEASDQAFKFQEAPDLYLWDQNKNTDWQQKFLGGTAKNRIFQGAISGGTEAIQYLVGGNYNNQTYVFPGNAKDENVSGYFSLTGRSTNQKLTINLTGNVTYNKNITPPAYLLSLAYRTAPNAPDLYTETGSLNWAPNPITGVGTFDNPFAVLLKETTSDVLSLNSNILINYQFTPSLTLKTTVGASKVSGNSFTPSPFTALDPAFQAISQRSSTFMETFSTSFVIEPQLLYKTQILGGSLDLLTGANFQSQNTGSEYLAAFGFANDNVLHNFGSATSFGGSSPEAQYKYLGIYGRIAYNLRDKYLISFGARRDGSSKFGPNNKFGNFGSVGAAWIFSNEGWIKSTLPFLSFGKLRASYGVSGNDAIPGYRYEEQYSNIDNTQYLGLRPLKSDGVSNPYFQWERVKKLEYGIDIGILDDRLLSSIVYYRNRSSNQLINYSLPSTAGQNYNFITNQNWTIQNSGWEFTFSTSTQLSKSLNWKTAVNLSLPRNKLISQDANSNLSTFLGYGKGEGYPFNGVMKGYAINGVDPSTGKYQFLDGSGNVVMDYSAPFDASYVEYFPKILGGFQNTFSYKKFSVVFFIQFTKQKGKNYLYSPVFTEGGGPGFFNRNQPIAVENRWRALGDIADFQRASRDFSLFDLLNRTRESQLYYVDASFLKLRNVSLSYQLIGPEQKSGVKSLRLNIQGQNLLTYSPFKGLDPETQELSFLPQMRLFSVGFILGI